MTRYLSLFSGIGGFELGIIKAYESVLQSYGYKREVHPEQTYGRYLPDDWGDNMEEPICIGYSEIDKYATQIYQKHFPEHKNYGDITKIKPEELPDFDLLVGGFPCQAFSIAGKRRGFDDTRGTLFFDIARILKEKRPRNFVLENVKGLLSHDNGNTFKTIISTLVELGYCVEWQVLNAKNFGVPQNRERVFIIGHLGGIPERKVFPIGESPENIEKPDGKISSVPPITTQGGRNIRGVFINQLNKPKHSNDRIYGIDGLSPTRNTAQGGNRQPFIVAQRGRYSKNPKSRLPGLPTEQMLEPNLSGVSNTLSTVQKDNMLFDSQSRIRRLTPLECERLMGYPDNWTKTGRNEINILHNDKCECRWCLISDTQRYKTLGNGIVSNVVEEVVKRVLQS